MRELRAYVWAYWCLANRASGKDLLVVTDSLRILLRADFPKREPSRYEPKVDRGYSKRGDALWLRPYQIDRSAFDVPDELFDAFPIALYEDRGAQAKLRAFLSTDEFHRWKNGEMPSLHDDEKAVLVDILGGHAATKLPYRGVVLIGHGRAEQKTGVTWVGVRTRERFASLPAAEQLFRLQLPEQAITTLPEQLFQQWWHLRPNQKDLEDISSAQFNALADNLVMEITKEFGYVAEAPIGVIADLHQPLSEVANRIEREHPTNGATLAFVSRSSTEQLEDSIFATLRHIEKAWRFRCIAIGLPHMAQYLSRYPWVWSKHVAGQSPVSIVRSHDDLTRVVQLSSVLQPTTPVPHPRFVSSTGDIEISGQRGIGKTFAIAQLIDPEALTIVLKNEIPPTLHAFIMSLIRDAKPSSVVIDNLHLWAAAVPPWLISDNARLIVTYDSDHAIETRKCQRQLLAARHFSRIDLDDLTEDECDAFRLALAEAYFPVQTSDDIAKWFDDAAQFARLASDLTPALLVAVLSGGLKWPIAGEPEPSVWGDLVATGALTRDELAIIESIAVFRGSVNVDVQPIDALNTLFTLFHGRNVRDFGATLVILERRGWLRREDPVVRSDARKTHARALGLWNDPATSERFFEYANWIVEHPDGPWAYTPERSDGVWHTFVVPMIYKFLDSGQVEVAQHVVERAIAQRPHMWTLYRAAADVYRRKGDHEHALDCYLRVAEAQPDDPWLRYIVDFLLPEAPHLTERYCVAIETREALRRLPDAAALVQRLRDESVVKRNSESSAGRNTTPE